MRNYYYCDNDALKYKVTCILIEYMPYSCHSCKYQHKHRGYLSLFY